ncbi:putative late blight resistance protein homolog R1A-3 [Henckelia pumila]|uniref:putative late blight resistance protein homolog R1A-3 n=1 Tax=Henckelia pumila TaxID=405737 RepID=UPI003C6E36B1
MAYAAVISLKQTLEQILLHPHRYSIPCDNKHIESFHQKLEFLQHFLEEYPSHKTNDKVTSLERRIRDAAYEAQDFMDLHLKNLLDPKYWRLLDAFRNDTIVCFKLIAKVDSIIREVINIKEQMEIKQGTGSFMKEEIKTDALRKDPSHLVSSDTKNLVVGFNHDLMRVKDQLMGQSSTLGVISIVGMGGIGKTTLATNVYNDPCVVNHFDIRVWVTVSQSYNIRDILSGMLASMNKFPKGDRLGLDVYQNLKGRRYLIMIDDIWDIKAWDGLKMMFPDDKTGSRIMLTTRIADLAVCVSPSGTLHQISPLNDDQSWKLLCAKVFGEEPCPLNLQKIGKTTAHNCGGLPLSVAVIGGLLSKVEKTLMAWQPIAENVTSFVVASDDRCSNILRLSYNYLPQYLKACFLYMGVFPKSHEIPVSKLIKMWVAEGFLRPDHGQNLEEVGERCLADLVDRSLILMSKKNSEGKIKVFRIHDLLLDFCIKEAKDEKFLQIAESAAFLFPTSSASERRVSIHREEKLVNGRYNFDSMSSTSYVRTVVCVGQCSLSSNLFLRFKLLSVLDAVKVKFLEFPPQVLELLNLRYIAFVYDGVEVPASITKLWNLQTLIIYRHFFGYRNNHLPVEMWMMVSLRHVRVDGYNLLDPSAANFDPHRKRIVLKDLQTLSGLLNLRFTKEMLQSIPNIKKIDVVYDQLCVLEKGWSYYQFQNLGNLHHLKALKISVTPSLNSYYQFQNRGNQHHLKALKIRVTPSMNSTSTFNFLFPPSLKTLTLCGVGIPWHDLAIIGSLPNLEVLELIDHACLGTKWEPNEEQFCELKVLVLERLELKHWEADCSHFPSLERLIIRMCNSLVKIPSEFGESSTLTTIGLYKCKASARASANEILEKQLSYGNDGFQVIYSYPKYKRLPLSERPLVRIDELLGAM